MKALWWFKENQIAGMARPGFNRIHWYELPFDQAMLWGWLGRYSSGVQPLQSFYKHLKVYGPKVFEYYKLDHRTGPERLLPLHDEAQLLTVVQDFVRHTEFLTNFEIRDDSLHFECNSRRLHWEAQQLNRHGVKELITLTENANDHDILMQYFDVHHIGVQDLEAPTAAQAQQVAEVVSALEGKEHKLAVHCLAGIGRTSTLLIAAHVLNGGDLDTIVRHVMRVNPSFILTGSQAKFVRSLKLQGSEF